MKSKGRIVNEFGEKIFEEELRDFAKKIRELSDEKVDELWFRCGFIISDYEINFKSLREMDIIMIRTSEESAMEVVKSLLLETRKEEFKKHLLDLLDEY